MYSKSVLATYTRVCLYPAFCCLFFILACTDSPPPEKTAFIPPADTTTPSSFYKRMNGFIIGKPVTLHLTSFNGRYTGYCYYEGQESYAILTSFGDTAQTGEIRLDELNLTDRLPDSAFHPYWLLKIRGDSAYGVRITGENTAPDSIRLKEAYPQGSYRMELIYHSLRAAYHDQSDTPFVTSTYHLLWPANASDTIGNTFITRHLAPLAGCNAPVAYTKYDVLQCIAENDKSYFSDYRKIITDAGMQSEELKHPINNHSRDVFWDIAGNENGLLTIEITSSEYTGGAHGNYTVLYHCLDPETQKIWTLQDMISLDTNRLKVLLDMAARRYFRAEDTASLQERLLVTEIPITENVYLTPGGIVFCYQPYEIASYADGVIPLFISYRELKDMLQEAFKKRMRLDRASQPHII